MKFLLPGLVLGLLSAQGAQAQQSLNIPSTFSDTIPFQLANGFLVLVEGRIGTLAHLRFILDTGATDTWLDKKLGEKLSLPRHGAKIFNFDHYSRVERASVPELQLGSLLARNNRVIVGDLKQFSEFAANVDGIVGMDLLSATQSLRIDYSHLLVTFKTSGASGAARQDATNALTVQLSVQGQPLCLIIDTGISGLLLYKDRLHKHLPQLKLTSSTIGVQGGRLWGESALVSGIRLGSDQVQASVFLIPGEPDSLPADIDGFVGSDALKAKTIELNFATNRVRIWQ